MRKTGSMNHVRFTVGDIPRAEAFYDPLLRFMGYELAEKSEERLAWRMPSPAGNRQWVIMSVASGEGRMSDHDRYSPGLYHFAWNADSRGEVDRFHELLRELRVEVLHAPLSRQVDVLENSVFVVWACTRTNDHCLIRADLTFPSCDATCANPA